MKGLYSAAVSLAEELNITPKLPTDPYETDASHLTVTNEQHYKRNRIQPFLRHILKEMKAVFKCTKYILTIVYFTLIRYITKFQILSLLHIIYS